MEDEFPEEFQHLRQDYNGLTYPGDLPGDLGLVPHQPAVRDGWRIGPMHGPMAIRWLGLTAAAAAVALFAGGALHALIMSGTTTMTVAVAPTLPQPTRVIGVPNTASTQASTPTAVASNTDSVDSAKKSTTTDDSIPLWSDVDSPTLSTAAAGLPSESLILPSISEVGAEKSAAEQAKNAQSKS